jgi:hypothetical protein
MALHCSDFLSLQPRCAHSAVRAVACATARNRPSSRYHFTRVTSGLMGTLNPLVTVLMPAHNSALFLPTAIESVLKQTYGNWELLAVDDSSTDSTWEILGRYASAHKRRIRAFHSTSSLGAAAARNLALEAAQGRYITFLDSDDWWEPRKLECQVSFMRRHRSAFSFTSYSVVDIHGAPRGLVRVPNRVTYSGLLRGCPIGCLTAAYDVHRTGKIPMPEVRMRNDYALWLKLLRLVPTAHGIDEVLANHRVHARSLTSNKVVAAFYQWKVYRQLEGLPLAKSIGAFSSYAMRGVRLRMRHMLRTTARGKGLTR